MSRRNFNDGQEITFEDLNAINVAGERNLHDRVVYELLQRKTDAFFGDSLKVEFASATSITVQAGSGFQDDNSQASPEPTKRLVHVASTQALNISAPDISLDRIDIVVAKAGIADEISLPRKFKDAISDTVSTQSLVVQKDWEADLQIVAGTPDASPSAPAVPAGYLKLAELYVTTVTGMAGAGAVTDARTILPIGAGTLVNTLAATRLTQDAELSIQQVVNEVDALLKNGYQEYTDLDDLSAHPAAPAASSDKLRFYIKDKIAYIRDDNGAISPIGSGSGGGGGGFTWDEPEGVAPLSTEENGQKVFLFESSASNKLTAFVRVPTGYISGRPVSMFLSHYSPSATDTQLLKTTTTLIRKNNDPMDDTNNQHISTNTAITNTVANQYREVELDLSDGVGAVNSVGITAGDLLKIDLYRSTDTDTADIRFVPSATEPKFG